MSEDLCFYFCYTFRFTLLSLDLSNIGWIWPETSHRTRSPAPNNLVTVPCERHGSCLEDGLKLHPSTGRDNGVSIFRWKKGRNKGRTSPSPSPVLREQLRQTPTSLPKTTRMTPESWTGRSSGRNTENRQAVCLNPSHVSTQLPGRTG